MKVNRYLLDHGRLLAQPDTVLPPGGKAQDGWFDVRDATSAELRAFLEPLDLHPRQLARCLDKVNEPGVVSFGTSVLLEYPASYREGSSTPDHLTILLQKGTLVTIRHGPLPQLDELIAELGGGEVTSIQHLTHIIYLVLDEFSDMNVEAQVSVRNRIQELARILSEDASRVSLQDLSQLRWKVENLVSLIEDQLYCISGLNASDNEALHDPHRRAFLEDLLSETEIAQRGVYRLGTRINDLYSDLQAAGNDRVEKRLRVLTIVSAITLPLGLVAGLLGMNVGGVPWTELRSGFAIVSALMVLIVLAEYIYFKRNGWFD